MTNPSYEERDKRLALLAEAFENPLFELERLRRRLVAEDLRSLLSEVEGLRLSRDHAPATTAGHGAPAPHAASDALDLLIDDAHRLAEEYHDLGGGYGVDFSDIASVRKGLAETLPDYLTDHAYSGNLVTALSGLLALADLRDSQRAAHGRAGEISTPLEGWKLVPAEPTEAMLVAFHTAVEESVFDDPLGYYGEAYAAMLSASPSLGEQGEVGKDKGLGASSALALDDQCQAETDAAEIERRVAKAIRILSNSRLHECTRIVEARDVLIYGGPEDAPSE